MFSDTCFIMAVKLCVASPRLVGGRKVGNSNMKEFFWGVNSINVCTAMMVDLTCLHTEFCLNLPEKYRNLGTTFYVSLYENNNTPPFFYITL